MAQNNSKYSWLIYINGILFADLTGIATQRKFSITRNDSDQISFSVSVDKLMKLAKELNVDIQDIIQSAISEIRVSRYGSVLIAGELMPWDGNVGADRMINLTAKGWFELLKYRRTSNEYTAKSQVYIATNEINTTLARPYGNSGNYAGISVGVSPSPDMTTVYDDQPYDDKTIYDVIKEMGDEEGGFDFQMTWDKKFNMYSQIGQIRSDIIFTYPGNVQDITYSVDPTSQFNSLTARGKGSGVDQITTVVTDSASQQKYGIRENTKDYPNVANDSQLASLANSDLSLYKEPLIIHQVVFDGSGKVAAPQVGSFGIGDRVQLFVPNFQLYSDTNRYFKIDKIEVEISDDDQEKVTLSMS